MLPAGVFSEAQLVFVFFWTRRSKVEKLGKDKAGGGGDEGQARKMDTRYQGRSG